MNLPNCRLPEVGSSEGSSGEGNGESPIAAILSALRDAKPGAEGVSIGKAAQTPKDKTVEQSAQPEVVVNKTAIVDQPEKKAVSVDVATSTETAFFSG